MPFDLPPGLPPQHSAPALLKQRLASQPDRIMKVQVGQNLFLVNGNSYLTEEHIQNAARAVDSPSKFILLLNALYAAAGYPLVNVEYAQDRSNGIIYVYVYEGRLSKVVSPPMFKPYFEEFEGQQDLTGKDLETSRILAGIKADRAGYDVNASYRISQSNPGDFILDLDATREEDYDPFKITTVFGNPGNRFLGRYFGFATLQYNTEQGDIWAFDNGTAFTSLGDSRGGESYYRGGLTYATVRPHGLYTARAHYTTYEVANRFGLDETEEAETISLGLEGSQFLYASSSTRWLIMEGLDYTDSIIEFTDAPNTTTNNGQPFPVEGQTSLDERYFTLRLGSTLAHSGKFFQRPANLTLNGEYRHGIGGDIDNLLNSQRDPDFNILTGKLKLNSRLFWNLVGGIILEGQKSLGAEVPQAEQWVLGGPDRLSAYLPGILVGDSGLYSRLELQLPTWQPARHSSLKLWFFVEGGTAEFEDRSGSTAATRAASDFGLKLELTAFDDYALTMHVSESISERNMDIFPGPGFAQDNDANFFFSVKATF